MGRPRTEPEEVRRRAILDAVTAVLRRTSYLDLNLDEVAHRADVAKGTIYLYFKDKDDLLVSVFEDMIAGLEGRFNTVAPADGSLESLRHLLEFGLDFIDETRFFLMPFSPGSAVLHSHKAAATHQARFSRHVDMLAGRLKVCMERGVLRRVDPQDAALFFISLMRMVMTRKFLNGSKRPLREEAPEVLDLFLNGVGAGRNGR